MVIALNLDDHLSPNRHVGVYAIVGLMKKQARRIAQANSSKTTGKQLTTNERNTFQRERKQSIRKRGVHGN